MNRQTHEEFEKEVLERTKPLMVPEESDECMREGYEHDPKVRGPRSRPEQERRLKKALKEYEDKFDADGSMVAAAKDALSEDAQTEEDKAALHTDKIMRENGIKKMTEEQKARVDALCEGGEK